MKFFTKKLYLLITFTSLVFGFMYTSSRAEEPWTSKQLMAPSDLNKIIENPNAPKTYIYSIGYQSVIKNSIDIGPGKVAENQKKFRKHLGKLPKDANIVIYCGCCPFDRCPNVRPMFNILNEMGFKNHKLLNLPQNIKVDWIDKGFAVKK